MQPTEAAQADHDHFVHTSAFSDTQSSAFGSSAESPAFSDAELEPDINNEESAVKPQQSQSYRRTGRRISVRSLLMAAVVAITAGVISGYATLYIKNNYTDISRTISQLGSFVKSN